jgi:hypothetical protein
VAVNLGADPATIDLWGNVTPVQRVAGADGRVSLSVSRTPTFLVGIDGQLMQTRASVGLDRPLIESSFQPHARRLRFTNAYGRPSAGPCGCGAARVVGQPADVHVQPEPGERFDREVTIEQPYNTVAGPKTIEAQFALQADGDARFTVPIALTVGLSDVGMQTIALRDGNDVVVQQMITNYGDKPVDYTAFAVFPGSVPPERPGDRAGGGARP